VVVDSESGQVLSVGVNLVLEAGLSAMHAEVVALSLAQRRLRSWDLGADGARLDLISSARPCLQCLGAVLWSGVRSLAFGADGSEVERITGFDEGPYPTEWETELDRRGIAVADGVRHDRALQVLEEFAASGAVVYNARGHGEVGTGEP
jgi:tRNA(Arg) A34 adenosine deaminase TadA